MSFLPEITSSYQPIYSLIHESIKGRILTAALELKVFDHLCQAADASLVASETGLPQHRCQALLDALAGCGLVIKKSNAYTNANVSEQFLNSASPAYIGDLVLGSWNMMVMPLENLGRILKDGFPATDAEPDREAVWAEMAHANAQYARAGLAQLAVEQISALPEFGSFRKMLDLAGGPGLVALALAEANPNLKGVVLDQPAVVEVARQYIDKYGFSDRVTVMGADYSKDDIGGGYDFIWVSAALNFYRSELGPVLKKIYNALNPGGVLACFQDGLTHERTRPPEMTLGFFASALSGHGMGFAQGEIAEAMLDAGFFSVRSRTLETDCGPMDLDVARKRK